MTIWIPAGKRGEVLGRKRAFGVVDECVDDARGRDRLLVLERPGCRDAAAEEYWLEMRRPDILVLQSELHRLVDKRQVLLGHGHNEDDSEPQFIGDFDCSFTRLSQVHAAQLNLAFLLRTVELQI